MLLPTHMTIDSSVYIPIHPTSMTTLAHPLHSLSLLHPISTTNPRIHRPTPPKILLRFRLTRPLHTLTRLNILNRRIERPLHGQ